MEEVSSVIVTMVIIIVEDRGYNINGERGVCVCKREKMGEGCVCVCARAREREREKACVCTERERERVCVRERERERFHAALVRVKRVTQCAWPGVQGVICSGPAGGVPPTGQLPG